jgi:hypothetical protein
MVGEREDNPTKTGKVITNLHPITTSGRLACGCKVDIDDFELYSMNGLAHVHRHLICDEGAEYLRGVVAIELKGEVL